MPGVTNRDEAVRRLQDVLVDKPSGLFTDFDGTLSGIAPTPAEASIYPGAAEALRGIDAHVDVVGIVTGRAIRDVQAMVGLPELLYVGNHGLEYEEGGVHQDHPAGVAAHSGIVAAFAEIDARLAAAVSTDGMVYENKRLSASIHYRVAAEAQRIGELLGPIVESAAADHELRVTYGKMMIELRPLAAVNKGTAIRDIVLERGLRSAVFLGDDVTDVDGFLALRELARLHNVKTLAVGVLTADTAVSVIETSDILLDGVSAVVDVLTELVSRSRLLASS